MTKIKCQFCEYEWDCISSHVYVSCPSCMHKTKTGVIPRIVQERHDKLMEFVELWKISRNPIKRGEAELAFGKSRVADYIKKYITGETK